MINTNVKTSIFKQFSDANLPLIENHLEHCVNELFSDERKTLIEAIKHSLLNGGKRIRPLLTLMSQNLFDSDFTKILPLASATEIIHTYSLIHDDLPCMDDDDYRRGKPTCHIKYGEDIAVLAGDTLNSLAFEILTKELDYKPEYILHLISYFSNTLGVNGLVGGQVLDILSTADIKDINHLKDIHLLKTGALFKACLVGPAILNNAPKEEQIVIEKCASHIGLLFQIIDDILDVIGDKKSLGKSPLKDVQMNKLTYVSLLGLDGAKKEAQLEASLAIKTLTDSNLTNTTILIDLINYILSRSS
ncbi:MAG: hypothetical protein CMP39_02195 [Rickettsiales bacterium]|nr:hypothetical protein [Rickettsiales bacterium]